MAKMQFDPVDAGLTLALTVSGFIMVGIASFSLFNVDFGATALTLAGTEISTAYLISVVAIVGTVVTNDNTELSSLRDDVDKLDDYYKYLVIGTAVVFVAWLFISDVSSFFKSGDLWGLISVAGATTAQMAIGYML